MIPFRKAIKEPLKNKKGFTILELVVVTVMISILSSIAIANFIPLRKKALDTTALSDARNLVQSVVDATLSGEDVDYTKVETAGAVGDFDTAGNPRTPVFVLSPGVEVIILGSSNEPPNGDTVFSATVYHTNGTFDPAASNSKNKKEYTCSVDESSGTTSLP